VSLDDPAARRTITERLGGPLVDHHVHILGPDVIRDWRAVGVNFSRPDSTYTSVAAWMASRGLDSTHVQALVLVPMAQLYGDAEFVEALKIDATAVQARVARENDHVAREAAQHPTRAVALCAAPVLADFAEAELVRCLAHPQTTGIKLHLAASGVDLREPAHVTRTAALIAFAAAQNVPVLLHLDTQQRGTETTDVRAFLDRALGPVASLPVIIAHAGGSGGYGAWTRSVLRTILAWRDSVDALGPAPRPVYIDLSAVLLDEPSEGVPASTTEERAALRVDVRAAGLDRFAFGSDSPVFHPLQSAETLRAALALSSKEARELFSRPVPAFFSSVDARGTGRAITRD
jgi:predicted TIM-barrel fold metal-dependent hydrolase